ncbi:hypothetical protein DVK02_08180 [Halobellus sp. Atlit-31R]|nr:hypothetical protein DVK02_08180 [Halobellus sp. Atlit-31R]
MSDRSIRVRLTKTLGPNQHPERGLFTVPPDEAEQMIRGLVIQLAHERLDDADGTVPRAEVLDEAVRVLEDVKAELERQYGEE